MVTVESSLTQKFTKADQIYNYGLCGMVVKLDQANAAVVHRLSKKLRSNTHDLDVLPSLRTLQSMSSALLDTIGTQITVPLAEGGAVTIKVIMPQKAVPYLEGKSVAGAFKSFKYAQDGSEDAALQEW